MDKSQRDVNLVDWIQDTVDRTATNIEGVHRSIAEIPLDVMRSTGLFVQTAEDVGDLQARSIGTAYDIVRDVNRRVFGLASDILGPPDDAVAE